MGADVVQKSKRKEAQFAHHRSVGEASYVLRRTQRKKPLARVTERPAFLCPTGPRNPVYGFARLDTAGCLFHKKKEVMDGADEQGTHRTILKVRGKAGRIKGRICFHKTKLPNIVCFVYRFYLLFAHLHAKARFFPSYPTAFLFAGGCELIVLHPIIPQRNHQFSKHCRSGRLD